MGKIIKITGCRNAMFREDERIDLVDQQSFFINTSYIYELKQFSNCTKIVLNPNKVYSSIESYRAGYSDHEYAIIISETDFILTDIFLEEIIKLINF